ncbi:unnamed protein product [Rotaria sp. Silwood2]|nr:unnamed protein product [Rotaria sp. Silwood2]CAF3108629.1 unnamed protein product [Rotaria sp. Silwood2]CAF3268503.1 unnamed protein product [Rotaria sp. Silwood2]CAF3343116.1 unnamed protein product [Rotaria sp. Silwood2]CAF4407259.1 unnamed protein product [Rotaria sp. Silwood2]
MATTAAKEALTYALEAFPNASPTFLREILFNYSQEVVLSIGLGIAMLWEYIYDRLFEHDPKTIAITASYRKIPENASAEDRALINQSPTNGYSESDKTVIDEILRNAKDERPKEQLKIYSKVGTLEDARTEFEKLNGDGNGEKKAKNVWVKILTNGKTAIVREESTDKNALATFEVKKLIGDVKIPIIKVRYIKILND